MVSTDGGEEAAWGPEGNNELFYRGEGKLMVVQFDAESEFKPIGRPQPLFDDIYYNSWGSRGYDVSPDGQRFVMIEQSERPPGPTRLLYVEGWFEELNRLVPSR